MRQVGLSVDVSSDYYRIFNLPEDYQIDAELLQQRYRDIQRECHPDRYTGKSAHEQRVAVQYAAAINQAYTVLRSPVQRALYLLERMGGNANNENATVSDIDFLARQIELRERLHSAEETADSLKELAALRDEVAHEFSQLQALFTQQYRDRDVQTATHTLAQMQFFSKLLGQLQDAQDVQDA